MGKHISVAATNQHTAMYTPTCERISYTTRLKASNNPNSEHRQFTTNHDNLNNHANYNYMQLTPCLSSVSQCTQLWYFNAIVTKAKCIDTVSSNTIIPKLTTSNLSNSRNICQGSVSVHIDKSCIAIRTASTAISRDCPCLKQPSQTTSSFKFDIPVHDWKDWYQAQQLFEMNIQQQSTNHNLQIQLQYINACRTTSIVRTTAYYIAQINDCWHQHQTTACTDRINNWWQICQQKKHHHLPHLQSFQPRKY